MKSHRAPLCLQALLTSTLLASGLALGDAPINAVPPAANRAPAVQKAAATSLALPATAPSLRIALPAPSATERGTVKAQNLRAPASTREAVAGTKGRPLAIGYGRPIRTTSQTVSLEALPWQTMADGTRIARIEIASGDAAALRVALRLTATDPDLSVRFSGNGQNAQVFGPIPANAIAADTARFGTYWTPTLEGDVAVIEFEAAAGAKLAGAALTIPRISHHLVSGAALRQPDAKTVRDIGTSGACNIDVACVSPQSTAFVNSRKAVAEIVFTQEDGGTYLCTGTLLNDSTASNTPYFFAANHCINSAMAARTMNTYWFFDAGSCGSKTVPPYVLQATGAALLARSEDWDWALLRLVAPPPAGTFFSAWRAEAVPAQATVSVIHHPNGDLKKWSQGTSPGYDTIDATTGATFIKAIYSQGTTEGGSSGAALLTFNATGGFYEVRGGLWGGVASCSTPTEPDFYSRLDNMLPLTRQYLTPGNNPSGTVVVVEFFNRTLQHYFISANPGEINDLDTGVHAGWERTGLRFLAYDTPVAGTNPVCRFYRPPAYGDSHFYSASAAECDSTKKQHPVDWIYESPNVFYIQLPNTTTGTCPAGTLPIWRFFNQLTTNHRYTADVTTRDDMSFSPTEWVWEGYGPGFPGAIMCTPVGS